MKSKAISSLVVKRDSDVFRDQSDRKANAFVAKSEIRGADGFQNSHLV